MVVVWFVVYAPFWLGGDAFGFPPPRYSTAPGETSRGAIKLSSPFIVLAAASLYIEERISTW